MDAIVNRAVMTGGLPRIAAEARVPLPTGFDWQAALSGLAIRTAEGVERVAEGCYWRTVRCGSIPGIIRIGLAADGQSLHIVSSIAATPSDLTGRARRMFDLDADVPAITAHLARQPFLSPLLSAWPGLRILGSWEPFEVAARSIIGQQVSLDRARLLSARLAERCGDTLPPGKHGLRYLFPTADQLARADLTQMGMPAARVGALNALAEAAIADPGLLDRRKTVEETVIRLRQIKGIGDWTAHYIAMRACGDADAFPHGDAGLLRGARDENGVRPTPEGLLKRAELWRPYRAYAAQYLWARDRAGRASARSGTSKPV